MAEAEATYRRVLAAQPDHAHALHLLGVIAHQAGRHGAAVELIRQAIERNGAHPQYFYNLGTALHVQGKRDDAIAAYTQAIRIKPRRALPRSRKLVGSSEGCAGDPISCKSALRWCRRR